VHQNTAIRAQPFALTSNDQTKTFVRLIFATTSQLYPFTSKRFHALLNSLFKVLFNFPSRYLFAIGLVVIFSLRWGLPPTLGCTLKQPDSPENHTFGKRFVTGLPPSTESLSRELTKLKPSERFSLTLQFPRKNAKGFSAGLIPVHSPLLRKSSLVSFPPLTNMLKFSG
jgi:hypothetical protein